MKINKKNHSIIWLKALLLFLAVSFLFTFLSRAADSFTVAKVTVTTPVSRKIQHSIEMEGKAEKNREIPVLTEAELRVETILVNEGQQVAKGETLAILDQKNIEETLLELRDERKTLQLQNQAATEAWQQECAAQRKAAGRAKADYLRLKKQNKKEKNRSAEEKKAAHQAEIEAKRAWEDALISPAYDNTAEINRIAIQKLNRQISKLLSLKKRKGKITAPTGGTITGILVTTGQMTGDTAVFTMTDESEGLKFVGQVSKEEAELVSAKSMVTIKHAEQEMELPITSLNAGEEEGFLMVTALLPADTFSLGDTITARVMQESETYPCTVPLSAVYEENGKKYILYQDIENTILGEQEVARKAEVRILEQNELYAALESDTLQKDCPVITDTDRLVKAGERIRLN